MTENSLCASTISMSKWIQEGDKNEECRPCLLPPLIQWYKEELQEKGFEELSSKIKEATDSGDPVKIAEVFDAIKDKVPNELKERLKEFDCHIQLFKENDNAEEE